jgi:arabinose-5-phosphate isomerase
MGDALAMVLLESRGFEKQNFAELHPGGSLGHLLLTKAEDIMRKGSDLVITTKTAQIRDVLKEMTAAKTGAAVIVDSHQKLEGIFTQGDFTRAFQNSDEGIGKREVGEFMTRNPITTNKDQLVGEVLKLLENNRIDELVVLDHRSRPVGVIDTQDLTRVRLF